MDAHWVHVLNRTNDDDVVVGVAQQLELVLLPAHQSLVDNHLVNGARLQSALQRVVKLFFGPHEARAASAQRERSAHAERVAEFLGNLLALEVARANFGRRIRNLNLVEQVFEPTLFLQVSAE